MIDEPSLKPRMTGDERQRYAQLASRASNVLEFGAGGSTLLAFENGVQTVTSVESDKLWLDRLRTHSAMSPYVQSGAWQPVHADIGEVGAWGRPADKSHIEDWPNYHREVWDRFPRAYDLILVDGRFRIACAMQAAIRAPGSTLVFHDFYLRPHYEPVLEVYEVAERIDYMAILSLNKAINAPAILKEYASDPR
ncbi:hypothetical protein [Parasphingopyxis marina]|uniref:Class I SAM-dependent methyltransferase n=1 Tax=Parasphingopyxis marina TaxID=2761622 RepID=A0A842HVJ0_9SPHN|nr:hypothetical protein [Parasphingopyxis marina]MBC2778048.1 hypothetical protein [Parasphingopyxis marina]